MTAHDTVRIIAVAAHERGKLYDVAVESRRAQLLLTDHTLRRIARWRLTDQSVLRALLLPEEVLRGHRNRFIAHRRRRDHVIRVVYEYEGRLPVVVTVYNPSATRYFVGGGTYEDQILA